MKGKKNEDHNIKDGMAMEAERPIRFFIFCKQEVAGKDFCANKQDQGNTADSMKKPDKHGQTPYVPALPIWFSGNHQYTPGYFNMYILD